MNALNRSRWALRGLGAVLTALLLNACGKNDSAGGFQPARETATPPPAPAVTQPNAPAPSSPESSGLEWDLPAGWTELPVNNFRQANFRPAGNEKAECYLSLLGGEAGGLESNITRWRTQIALPPLAAADIASLPHAQLLGREGVVVDFAGTWKGMSGTENQPGWRLVGVLQVDPAGSAFFKMFGPDALISAEKEHFLALARSLRPSHAGMRTPPAPAAPAAPPPMSPDNPAVASLAGDQQGLAWMAPGSWTKGADKAQRTVTYQTPGAAECYVTAMSGEAGGIGSNVNRWRTQLGCTALSAGEIDALEHIAMLGADGRLVAIEGAGEHAGKELLGALVFAGTRTVFVKMTGPKDAVLKETENFKAFAQSLKEAK